MGLPLSKNNLSVSLFESCKTLLSSSLKTKFYFKPNEIEIIERPSDFYEQLKLGISGAKKRVFISSLYLGTHELDLIKCISTALQKNQDLKVYFMVDGLRGTRETPNPCSASLLASLVKEYSTRVDIRCYKTPKIFGLKESLIPKRFNEGLGLQHMKIYGFDNKVILSGANLSTDYFTNRQDRYYIFHHTDFTNYYFRLHQLISRISFKALYSENLAKYTLVWPQDNLTVNPQSNRRRFLNQTSVLLKNFFQTDYSSPPVDSNDDTKYPTIVYPISQMTPLFNKSTVNSFETGKGGEGEDYSTERSTILKLLDHIGKMPNGTTTANNNNNNNNNTNNNNSKGNSNHTPINWTFTAGYFNMLPEIKQRLLNYSKLQNRMSGKVITASSHANGFYESKGISKYLPDAYAHLSFKFLKDVLHKRSNIELYEWKRGIVTEPQGWSYHAKGIWLTEGSARDLPTITIIGSSNYTKRAYQLDLESNCVINTKDVLLQEKMRDELENLMKYSTKVTLEDFKNDSSKKISSGVKLATRILGDKL